MKYEGDQDEVDSMKSWLRSLSEEQIQEAMSFTFNNDNTGKCHEYDLLMEMLSLQVPPSTPIHPKAMGVKRASNSGASDGRSDSQRIIRGRFRRPRLFKLIERSGAGISNLSDLDNKMAMEHLPPEIAGMLRKETSAARIKRNKNHGVTKKCYDIIARKFEMPNGEILSIGATKVMRDADELILKASYIQSGCRLTDSHDKNYNDRPVRCRFQIRRQHQMGCKSNVLEMLRIVSRGRCFTKCPSKSISNTPTFFAPWFEPMDDWFSLPLFLSSCYEAALWYNFQASNGSNREIKRIPRTIIEESFEGISTIVKQRLLASALIFSLQMGLAESLKGFKTRDFFLYEYFSDFGLNWKVDLEFLHLTPLIEVGTVKDKIRMQLAQNCEIAIARIKELDLLANIANNVSDDSNLKAGNSSRKKKKRRKKKRQSHRRKLDTQMAPIDESVEKPAENDGTDSSSSLVVPPVPLEKYSDKQEMTKATIMVLEVLNDIYDKAFLQLGFEDAGDDDGFKPTAPIKSEKVKNEKFILRKSKKKQQISIIGSETNETLNGRPYFLENQMTIKRNNVSQPDAPQRTIWNYVSRPVDDSHNHGSFTGEKDPNSQRSQHPHFTSLFTPPPPLQVENKSDQSFFDLSGNVSLPLHQNVGGFLHDLRSYEYRQSSMLSELFDDSDQDGDANFASSTAASIASSILDNDDVSSGEEMSVTMVFDPEEKDAVDLDREKIKVSTTDTPEDTSFSPRLVPSCAIQSNSSLINDPNLSLSRLNDGTDTSSKSDTMPSEALPTPPSPKQPPILVSLADLGELRKRAHLRSVSDLGEDSTFPDHSRPISIKNKEHAKIHRSYSREDLRISSGKKDTNIRNKIPPCSSRTVDFSTLSYKNAALKKNTTRRARSVSSQELRDSGKYPTTCVRKTPSMKSFTNVSFTREVIIDGHLNVCAQSESALDDHEDSSHWNVIPKIAFDENDNVTATRDGATTISSMPGPHDQQELVILREERNAYQDMYLTMAAEVSKLKNMLAIERMNSNSSLKEPTSESLYLVGSKTFDPDAPFFQGHRIDFSHQYSAMSDTGLNQMAMSEDGTDPNEGRSRLSRTNSMSNNRIQYSVNGKAGGGSDMASQDYDNTTYSIVAPSYAISSSKLEGTHLHGFQSRLSADINTFVATVMGKLQKQETRKLSAIKRLSMLVTTIWPRAQVHLYGSHRSDLRLPSSDLDFVICLPNVHKKAPADTPGALEGRNAINESNQKLLARKLKSESWIELKSIKVIERTIIPVIKVTTKDSRSKSLQLDISFDSPQHHGLETANMVKHIMEDLPTLRPIVLVLKQLLLDKGLSTAYTGGISSYCLFLMITRYVQEQNHQWLDTGSLLMGCLDFYGNVFDARKVGISVVNGGQYFRRPQSQSNANFPQQNANDTSRRHNFQDQNEARTASDPSRPFTFDPLFVEDPTSPNNNVGRNSFRINQVQRAFSDVHRTLVASLEWDISSGLEFHDEENIYPLLKCVLKTEDTYY